MLEIVLIEKGSAGGTTSGAYPTEPHPLELDFPLRDGKAISRETIVRVHEENLVAPILAHQLHGKRAGETYSKLYKALEEVRAWPHRPDGRRALELLISWCDPKARTGHPEGTWYVTGADRVPAGRYLHNATQPRYSVRSLLADPYARRDEPVRTLGEFERMIPAVADLRSGLLEDVEISIRDAMKRDVAIDGGSKSGSRARSKSKSGGATFLDGHVDNAHLDRETERQDRLAQIDAGTYKPTVRAKRVKTRAATKVVRLHANVARALEADPRTKEVFAALGAALVSGVSYAAALAQIARLDAGGDAPGAENSHASTIVP